MFTLRLILADDVTIQLGDHVWAFGTNFLMYLAVAAVIGLLAEFLVGRLLPFGLVGALITALIGVWLLTKVILLTGIPDLNMYGVPIVKAFIGATIVVAV